VFTFALGSHRLTLNILVVNGIVVWPNAGALSANTALATTAIKKKRMRMSPIPAQSSTL
jgi:hypothetical protein